ncbi:zonular occludens toxin domain-containing protein [Arhodomonas sp. SL1]|uniref:zonular occludens toxin domain-containing protein n=1 Tax=Arhodomonas sp. SL1 TaxID=3425691 RepID=UPI003F883242
MLTLVTGTPGAGKSLYVIHTLQEVTERPVYYHGIEDLKLPWYPLEEPRNWPEEVPDGAIVVLDEVQQYFGPRGPQQKVPEGVAALETHRHRGIDLYFITQHPNLLDHHARRLVGEHVHLKRNFGAPFATLYHGNEVMDPKDRGELAKAQKTQWRYPKKTFYLYKSAEVHTHRFRLPKKLLWAIPALAAVVGGAWYGYQTLWGEDGIAGGSGTDPAPTAPAEPAPGQAPAPEQYAGTERRPAPRPQPVDWRERMTPEVPGLPWTAPLYAEAAKPKTVPRIKACVASEDRCTCYTQQATRISGVDDATCRRIVEHGYFDFMRDPEGNDRERQQAGRERLRERLASYRRVRALQEQTRRIRAGDYDGTNVPTGGGVGPAASPSAGEGWENAERGEPVRARPHGVEITE